MGATATECLDMNRWLPPVASAHGPQIDSALNWVHWLMAILFVGWIIFFVVALWRFRRSRNQVASYTGATTNLSSRLEGAVAVAEGILLIGVSVPLWAARVSEFPDKKDAVEVRVVGEQFAWNIHYPGPDGKFGKTAVDKIDIESNPLGLDRTDPDAQDDVTTINQLHLPVGKPGIVIPIWWEPTVTTAQMREKLGKPEFVYEIACAQLCGLGHYRMRGFVTI